MTTRLGNALAYDILATRFDRHYAALELVAAQGTAINTTIAALTPVTGDTLTVRNTGSGNTPARLLQIWADVQLAGTLRVRSPRFHDNVQGIRIDTIASDPTPLLPWGFSQNIYPNDVLAVELAGSSTAGDIEYVCLLNYYAELPGVNGQFVTPDAIMNRIVNLFTVENTIATGTGGGWTGAEAINAEFDQWHAGSMYGLLGYTVDAECAAIAVRGGDTGNLRVGGPGDETQRELTADWFVRLSRAFNLALIPVFRADNKAGILVDALQDENGTDVTVTTYWAELGK